MYGGFSAMSIEYACVFDGKEIPEQCDYGIKLNPEQIVLPNKIKTFPPGDTDAVTNYHKWVRKKSLLPLLEQLAKGKTANAPQ